jgi:two-component system, response regulator
MEIRKTILLVEDDANDEWLTRRALESCRIASRLVVVRDGADALSYLLGSAGEAGTRPNPMPEIVLLDLNLPRMNGLEVLRRVRADSRMRCLPIVILTSSTEETDIVQSYRLGANSFVQKPVDFDRFVDIARSLGVYWLTVNRLPRQREAN